MGYHNGYAFNSDGTPNTTTTYNGLFTGRYAGSSLSIATFLNTSTSNVGNMQVGFEWGVSNGAAQSASLPSAMTDLNVHDSSGWHLWSARSVSLLNTHSGVSASFNYTTNQADFR